MERAPAGLTNLNAGTSALLLSANRGEVAENGLGLTGWCAGLCLCLRLRLRLSSALCAGLLLRTRLRLSAVSLRTLVPQPGQSGRNWSNCLLSRCARLCAGPSLPLRLSSIFCAGLYVFLRLRLSCASMSCPGSAPAGTRSDSSLNWSKWAKPAPPFQTGQNKQPKSPTSAPAAHRFRAGRKAARGRPDRLSVAYWSHQLSESSVRASYPSPSLLSEPPIRVSYPSRPSESFGGGGR